jgi:DNA-directed RNA polymerase alpha subunit
MNAQATVDFDAGIDVLDLPVRVTNRLNGLGIFSVRTLCEWSAADLRKHPRLGLVSITAIEDALLAIGRSLRAEAMTDTRRVS